ncbi:DUF357 domain-containing protein [Methanoculleus sp. Wushi-C6]|uniref:DUF357 domain-containing protein n=1 Tax=Methanoculleus caldifontis TaxID=2651577 RepID=A0ABU3X3S8_9EURY|nr:DUF357 domain-containing protein [Methanoculleus sp. Wushi-C6]MDV2482707.1 DUF357 domain-containing protein [Methanoculleus sp. Wushi-C6]
MILEAYGDLFSAALRRTSITVPGGTLLYLVAGEVLEMAAAYRSDGFSFLHGDDPVNALAAFAYGLGWLDAGSQLGLLGREAAHSPDTVDAEIPASRQAHLVEKTHRYRRMLSAALAAAEVGPDVASPLHAGARAFHAAAESWYAEGVEHLEGGDLPGALARFSYGYAWLDAGVRAGLFAIAGDRGLFTV